jgi:hypothetical protein
VVGGSKMLHFDQTTVSKYLLKFKTLADQKGIDAAALKYKVQDEMKGLVFPPKIAKNAIRNIPRLSRLTFLGRLRPSLGILF